MEPVKHYFDAKQITVTMEPVKHYFVAKQITVMMEPVKPYFDAKQNYGYNGTSKTLF
jgi:hypothetical protein